MSLPAIGLVVVTDRAQAGGRLLGVSDAAVAGGARGVLLREKDLSPDERRGLALDLVEMLTPVDGALLVASDVELARQVGARGVHLAADDPWPDETPDETGDMIVGRSCHTVAELVDAERHGADYATLSPIFPTASKPGYGPAVGVDGLASACRGVPALAVVAQGGIDRGRVAPCVVAGAAGVAVMGAVMEAEDPASVVRGLLGELAGVTREVAR
jgi:thiamine-phosphate pyrophosphorylase